MQRISTIAVLCLAAYTNAAEVFDFNTTETTDYTLGDTDDGLTRYTSALAGTWNDFEITLNGQVPNYVKGDLINACPSLFEVGKYKLTYYMDGFFRYNRYRIEGKSLKFSSKLVDDNRFYTRSMKAGEPQDMLFSYPVPKRWADSIPGITMNWCGAAKQCDNIGIMPWQLPDGTMVFTTDSPDFIKFSADDLSTQGWHEWTDKLQNTEMGTTHIVEDLKTGDTIGLLTNMYQKVPIPKQQQVFYRITKENPTKRVTIGTIPAEDNKLWYYHSFGHTADQLLFPQISVTMSMTGLMAGSPMENNFILDSKQNLKFYIMNIADGSYKKYDAGHYAFVMHTGNNYVENGIYTTYHECYISSEDPFDFQAFKFLHNKNRTAVSPQMRFRRYDINMATGEVKHSDVLTYNKDIAGFPIINPTYQGKKNCYSWITELLFSQGSTAVLKIDHCHGNKVTRWEEKGTWVSEAFFVNNPANTREDDGAVMVSLFDEKINKNRLVLINGQTMHTMSDTTLPTWIPQTLHQGWYPKKK